MRHPLRVLLLAALLPLTGCLLQPRRALLRPPAHDAPAPALYRVTFSTTTGPFVIEVHRDWAPRGADRFYYLARHGFYNGAAFFRVVPKFVVQWGLGPDPKVNMAWDKSDFPDDPVVRSNTRGMVTFAKGGLNSRTTQVYINFGDNSRLDKLGFATFGQVISGMNIVYRLYSGYGEGAPRGHGPSQGRIQREGAAYLQKNFPLLDRIVSTRIAR
ncbi:MAG: peptidylprolyl isomerase [Terriglobales bacterium]